MKVHNQIQQKDFISTDGFIKDYQKLIKDVVIPYQHAVLHDAAADNSEKSHVVQNFINAGKMLAGEKNHGDFYGMVFQDSDAAKWLEAVAYALAIFPDEKLEQAADELIEIIAKAQDSDGYLNTYFTLNGKEKRWTNICEGHELYCAGHMMEAACAYFESTGKRKLLDVMLKNTECIYKTFIEGDEFMFNSFPGHPEVELALMKMYRISGNKHCYELAKHFVDVRGQDPQHFEKEAERRTWTVWGTDGKNPGYNQADMPVRNQKDAKGHAVRAVYLYTGMADVASEENDAELKAACERLWDSITKRQMYVTGGIGSTNQGEAFSVDYDLPNDTAYCETCAAIGLMFFASRMLEMDVNRKFSDTMERAFYNAVLAGMQLDGKKFFYVNPLEVVPGIAGVAQTHRHDLPQRPSWYACACCPPNVARLVSSFGKYAYGENSSTAFCHLYASGKINFANGMKICCSTKYPYGFQVDYEIQEAKNDSVLAVRIPAWSKKWSVLLNGKENASEADSSVLKNGYIYLKVSSGDKIKIVLDSSAYFIYPSPKVPDLSGQVAVARGPLIYCAEGVDNQDDVLSLGVLTSEKIRVVEDEEWMPLIVSGKRTIANDELYSTEELPVEMTNIKMVPYHTWGNRGLNQMKVYFPKG